MSVRKRYKLFVSGGSLAGTEGTSTSIDFEDISAGVDPDDDAVFDVVLHDPSIIGYDRNDAHELMLRLTREELAEMAAICRVLLGIATSDDLILAEGPNVIQ